VLLREVTLWNPHVCMVTQQSCPLEGLGNVPASDDMANFDD
jgi:hypothetical protein